MNLQPFYFLLSHVIHRFSMIRNYRKINCTQINAPIFVYEEILETECLKTGESTTDPMGGSEPDKDELLQEDTIGILKTALQKAIEEEDYERAAQIRDQINQLKNNL